MMGDGGYGIDVLPPFGSVVGDPVDEESGQDGGDVTLVAVFPFYESPNEGSGVSQGGNGPVKARGAPATFGADVPKTASRLERRSATFAAKLGVDPFE
jgi:hypothetical protein